MAMRFSPHFRILILGIFLFFGLLACFHILNLNFEAYGVGSSTTAPLATIFPDSQPASNVWKTIEGTHPPRYNISYGSNIPNILNFVHLLPDGVHDFSFPFKEVLAVYAGWLYTDPDIIYLHTNAPPEAIDRARSGRQGKWNSIIFNIPQLVIRPARSLDFAGNGVAIIKMPHKSDFARVAALDEIGGMYLDMDAIPLRDLRPLLEVGFNTVLGRQVNNEIMSGNFFGKPRCEFFTRWRIEMHQVFDQGWVTHSNEVMTRLAKRLSRLDREVLVMEAPTMGPLHWQGATTQEFYRVRQGVPSNLAGIKDGDPLPDFTENVDDRWAESQKSQFPKWQRDYADTYILHSWHENRGLRLPNGFDHVTPRYVLERRSDFSRAVYHIAKHMYDHGFISFDDPWKYAKVSEKH
jgi:hypothetical protein